MDAGVVDAARDAIARRRLPGLLVAVRHEDGDELWHQGVDAAGQPLGGSLFPVASLTKLATALSVLRLVDVGGLGLADPLSRHLPEAGAAQPGVTLRRLLAHTAGLG